ncbi:MAG: thioredoxin domain-containing protein [Candidatus Paceibacterota bacterium]
MNTKKNFLIFIIIVVVIIGGLGIYLNLKPQAPSKLDGFAQCLKSSGAEFYGAFWCPHCQEQKAEFGSSEQYLPYIECSNPDNTQTQVCIDKKIEGYPTWIFTDGERLSGKLSLETLAEKTQCVLPQ